MRDLGELASHWRITILPQDLVASVVSEPAALLLLRESDKRPHQRSSQTQFLPGFEMFIGPQNKRNDR